MADLDELLPAAFLKARTFDLEHPGPGSGTGHNVTRESRS